MLPNEFVSITSIHRNYRSSYRHVCVFEDVFKVANEVLSNLSAFCMARYGVMPYETLQVITEGSVDSYTYYVTFPKEADSHYIVRFVSFNDLPF